ncbi:MAG: hypothetical protein FJ320_00315 [SAR202 cluster bacterium]|nr:hypothetical protein [SAR202 cluster bacterium]
MKRIIGVLSITVALLAVVLLAPALFAGGIGSTGYVGGWLEQDNTGGSFDETLQACIDDSWQVNESVAVGGSSTQENENEVECENENEVTQALIQENRKEPL